MFSIQFTSLKVLGSTTADVENSSMKPFTTPEEAACKKKKKKKKNQCLNYIVGNEGARFCKAFPLIRIQFL